MSTEYDATDMGDISVDNEVIRNIALKAATEISGIHEIKYGRLGRIWNTLFRKNVARGIKLEFANDSEVSITLKLSVEYGTNIPQVAGIAQENVKKAVEHMTGLTVAEVAVKIACMYAKKDAAAREGAQKEIADESLPAEDNFASE